MKKIIFIGGFFSDNIKTDIQKNSKGVIQYAADALQKAVLEGLFVNNQSVSILNLPYIGSFPFRYKKIRFTGSNLKFKDLTGVNIGFNNLSLYKLHSRYFNLNKRLGKIEDIDSCVIIIYAIHFPFLKAAVAQKMSNPNLKICLIVPDLPEYMGGQDTFFRKLFHDYEQGTIKSLLNSIDAFVLLSKHMSTYLNLKNKPYVVMEGIFNNSDDVPVQQKEKNFTILYSGTIARRYGILNLLEAFSQMNDATYRLWICGEGDGREDVERQAQHDLRIKYFGQQSREDVLILQKKATVLINPRTSEGEFTKYSFPSKTMEYFASGTPTILNRLEGIPDEYYDYCIVCESGTPAELRDKIIEVANMDAGELSAIGEKARQFILKYKNPEMQTKGIINLINRLN